MLIGVVSLGRLGREGRPLCFLRRCLRASGPLFTSPPGSPHCCLPCAPWYVARTAAGPLLASDGHFLHDNQPVVWPCCPAGCSLLLLWPASGLSLFFFSLLLVCLGLDRFEHAADPVSCDPDPLPSIRAGVSWRAVFLVPVSWGWTLPRGLPLATIMAASSVFSGERCSQKARQGECSGARIDALVPCCGQCTMVGGGVRHFLVGGRALFWGPAKGASLEVDSAGRAQLPVGTPVPSCVCVCVCARGSSEMFLVSLVVCSPGVEPVPQSMAGS